MCTATGRTTPCGIRAIFWSIGLSIGFGGSSAWAEEPHPTSEPPIHSDSTEVTQVVDAFDESDPFDINLSLGYEYERNSGRILREYSRADRAASGGGYTRGSLQVAGYRQTVHRLNARADVGLYHDLALVLRLPIILSDDRRLTSGSDASGDPLATQGAPNEVLFSVPFSAPTRSGIEYLALGLDVGVLNQYRNPSRPSWIFGFETRWDVSEPLHACNRNPAAGQVGCAAPGDTNRNGRYDAERLEGSDSATRKPGVSRGVTGLEVHTYLSKRVKYIEPYGGFRMLAEFPNASSDYNLVDLDSSLVNHPPLEGTMTVGMAVIPWEVRDQYQRLTLDFRLDSTYRSEGRDYSPLFDALGSSAADSLREPNYASYRAGADGTSVIDTDSQRVYFTGLTDVQGHLKNRLSAQFVWQAAQYVKFVVGSALSIVQSHVITYDQACNSNFKNREDQSGPCRKQVGTDADGEAILDATGIPNPNYRQLINTVGRRFHVEGERGFDAWVNATVMF